MYLLEFCFMPKPLFPSFFKWKNLEFAAAKLHAQYIIGIAVSSIFIMCIIWEVTFANLNTTRTFPEKSANFDTFLQLYQNGEKLEFLKYDFQKLQLNLHVMHILVLV